MQEILKILFARRWVTHYLRINAMTQLEKQLRRGIQWEEELDKTIE